jgi:hypothetical protein
VAELTQFTKRVNLDTPKTGKWEFLSPETVRYRTTPDFDVRDQYGPGAEPPPEAIAREMVDSVNIAPDTVIVEVVSSDGEYLGEFSIIEDFASDLVSYQKSYREFVNATRRAGYFTDAYFRNGPPITVVNVNNIELRRAYFREYPSG